MSEAGILFMEALSVGVGVWILIVLIQDYRATRDFWLEIERNQRRRER